MADDEKKTVEDKGTDEEDDSTDESKSKDEGGDDDASKKKTDTGEESDDDEEDDEDDDKKTSKKSDDDAEPEIPVRKVVGQQNIIARKNKTIKKLREEKGDDDDGADDDEGDDDLIPSAAKGVRKEVARALAPLMETLGSRADEDDLKDLYGSEPDAKKFDRSIRAYMKHPAYKGVAASVIYHHLAWPLAQATGAKKKIVADTEAGNVKGAGSSKKPKGGKGNIPSPEELEDMSDADFEKLQDDVRQGKYRAT